MRVFAYLRVSGKAQLDGDGFDRQADSIAAFCQKKGWIVGKTFSERGVSGTSDLDNRPAFLEMLGLSGPGTAQTIVVERSDRLARDLIINEMLVLEATKRGIKIFEAQSGLDLTCSDDPTRVMLRQILAVLAQWDKSVLVRRLRAARDRMSADRGSRIEGNIPFEKRGKSQAAIAFEIFNMHAIERFTFKDIAGQLSARRVPTPRGKQYWNASTVCEIYDRFSRSVHTPPSTEIVLGTKVCEPLFNDFRHLMPEPKV